jgi:hypothetical protein
MNGIAVGPKVPVRARPEKAWEEGEHAAMMMAFGKRRPAKARKHGRALRNRLLDRESAQIP